MVFPYLLLFPDDSVVVIVGVGMGLYCIYALIEVVLVVAEVLLRRLLAPAMVQLGAECGMVLRIVLWGHEVASQVLQVLLRCLQSIVLISGGRIPWCCRWGFGCRNIA